MSRQNVFSMIDIGHKPTTDRLAVATGVIEVGAETFALIRDRQLPKGDALILAEIAGIAGAKKVSDIVPLSVGFSEIDIKDWVGHRESVMVHHYRHLRPGESQKRMQSLDLLSDDNGSSEN